MEGDEAINFDTSIEKIEEWSERKNAVHFGGELDVRIFKKWELICLIDNHIFINSKRVESKNIGINLGLKYKL